MIKEVDKDSNDTKFVPEEGQRGPLSTNKTSFRCPSFGIKEVTEDDALEYLAEVLVEAFLENKKYEHNKKQQQQREQKTGDNLLPSIHKGTNG